MEQQLQGPAMDRRPAILMERQAQATVLLQQPPDTVRPLPVAGLGQPPQPPDPAPPVAQAALAAEQQPVIRLRQEAMKLTQRMEAWCAPAPTASAAMYTTPGAEWIFITD
jgi:hypothetical protein